MESCTKAIGCVGVALKAYLMLLSIYVLIAVHSLGVQWQKEIVDVDVYTVQDADWWGPVTMMVPNNCSVLEAMMNGRRGGPTTTLPQHALAEMPPSEVQKSWLGHVILPPETDVIQLTAIHKCNQIIEAENVTWSQYYWSAMITASSDFGIEDLHNSRFRFFWLFAFSIISFQLALIMFAVFQMQTGKLIVAGQEAVFQCTSMFMLVLGSLTQFSALLTMVSLFVTYWHHDAYIMNYFPGRAFILIYLSGFLNCCALLGKIGEVLKACCSCFLCCFVSLPLMGWNFVYQTQFEFALFFEEHKAERIPGLNSQMHDLEVAATKYVQFLIVVAIVGVVQGICRCMCLTSKARQFATDPLLRDA